MNLGFPEMLFIFLLALIIFGPKKMPEIGRQIGRALAEFKRASNEFKAQIETEISNLDREPEPQPERSIQPRVDAAAAGAYSPSPPEAPPGTVSKSSLPIGEVIPPSQAPDA